MTRYGKDLNEDHCDVFNIFFMDFINFSFCCFQSAIIVCCFINEQFVTFKLFK